MYASPSKFVKHGPCDKCGSRDNVGYYSNGTGFCFGCGAFYRGVAEALRHPSSSIGDSRNRDNTEQRSESVVSGAASERQSGLRSPPNDAGTYFPEVVMTWMSQYDIGVKEMLKYNVKWSPSREQLLYLFYGEGKDLVLWQARNFRKGTDHKGRFFTGGTPETTVAAYYPDEGSGKTAVIVEDCASGIKCAMSGVTGVPVFGAKMSPGKMKRICDMYENVIWWLDSDKFTASAKQSNLCKLLGANSRVINTAYDPKEYSIVEMQELIEEF